VKRPATIRGSSPAQEGIQEDPGKSSSESRQNEVSKKAATESKKICQEDEFVSGAKGCWEDPKAHEENEGEEVGSLAPSGSLIVSDLEKTGVEFVAQRSPAMLLGASSQMKRSDRPHCKHLKEMKAGLASRDS
jgi:hypothetical protein